MINLKKKVFYFFSKEEKPVSEFSKRGEISAWKVDLADVASGDTIAQTVKKTAHRWFL